MSTLVASVAQKIAGDCRSNNCKKGNCSLSLEGAPARRLIVDLDCAELPIPTNQRRCDYLFVGEKDRSAWVVPIELKGGGFKADDVAKQLQGGSRVADAWLPPGSPFQFVPVLAHGKGVHNKDLKELRRNKVTLRGKERQTVLLRCREKLMSALS